MTAIAKRATLADLMEEIVEAGYVAENDGTGRFSEIVEEAADLLRHPQPPLVLIHVDGGIAEEWYVVEGTGKPEVYVLDFDREGEPPGETDEFCDVATETLAKFKARGVDTSDLDADVEKLRPSEDELADDGKTLIAGVLYDNETGEEADPQ